MGLKLKNKAISRLAAGIAAGDLSLSVVPGEGTLFPTLGVDDFHPATLIRASDLAVEIVKVTARAVDVLTIERAQEGTTALAFIAGDRVELRMTAQTFLDLNPETVIHDATSKATPVDADEVPLVDSADSNTLKKLTWANLKATMFAAFGVLTAAATNKATPVDADVFPIGDSAAANATKKLTWANIKAALNSLYALVGAVTGTGITMATGKLLGRSTAGTGAIEEITIGTGLSLTAGTLSSSAVAGVSSVGGYEGDVTAADLLAAIKTVDGSGSGLDADTLDGQSSAYYATAASVTGKMGTDLGAGSYPVGTIICGTYFADNDGSAVAPGGTSTTLFFADPINGNTMLAGTWRNIGGFNISASVIGVFNALQRIA